MEDEDSGIFQSKNGDTDHDSEISYCSTIGFKNDDSSSSSQFGSDSDFDALSTLSENDTESSEDAEFVAEIDNNMTGPKEILKSQQNKYHQQPAGEKKTLHLDELLANYGLEEDNTAIHCKSFETNQGDGIGADINSLFPRIKMKGSKRDEHWNFENGSFHRKDQWLEKESPQNRTKSNSKKVLSLQLSDLENSICDSDFVPVKDDKNKIGLSTMKDTTATEKVEETKILQFEFWDADETQCSEWREMFNEYKNVTIRRKHHLEGNLCFDALVIPGNSFGFLDGEPEIQYTNKFGWKLQEDIQKIIREEHGGELIVGQASVMCLDDYANCGIKHAIYVPVMRVPLQVGDTVNAYLAFRAALKEVKIHNLHRGKENGISTILCPPLCNGFGGMPARRIALQMRTAYDTVIGGSKGKFLSSEDLGAMATNHVQMTTKIGKW